MRKSAAALLLLAAAIASLGQTPAFEAASVKPSKTGAESSTWDSRPGYLVMKNQSLQRLVAIAYSLKDEHQVFGGPKWVASDRFDIEARAAGPAKDPELLLMLRNLLADRFQLAVHRETKIGDGFYLKPIKEGIHIRPDATEGKQTSNTNRGRIVAQRISMASLAESLARMLAAPVVDRTDAKGLFSFTLEWTPDPLNSTAPGESLDDALGHQLGLQLERAKLPIDQIVIDQAERPTGN